MNPLLHLFVLLAVVIAQYSDAFSFVPTAPSFSVPDRRVNKRTDVVCVGEVLYDCIADVDCNGLSFEQVEAAHKWQMFPGGATANVACALSKLGVRSLFGGGIGDDEEGQALQKMLTDCGVESLCSVSRYPTRRVMVTRGSSGDRQFSGFHGGGATESFADCYYEPPVSAKWLANNAELAIVTGTLGLHPLDAPTARLMKQLKQEVAQLHEQQPTGDELSDRERAPLFVVDLNVREVFWADTDPAVMKSAIVDYARGVDIVKLTDEEAEWAFDIDPQKALRDPECLMELLQPREGVLVTGGERGASCFFRKGGVQRLPAFAVQATDTTGAGDAFTAGFLSALAMSSRSEVLGTAQGLAGALRMACAAGALTCTKTGAIESQPTLPEVVELLIANNILQ